MTDIERKRGDTYADEFEIVSDTTGAVIDISAYTFKLTVDPSPEPTDATNNVFQLTGTITDGPAGLVAFSPDATQADNVGEYYFDIELIDAAGKKRSVEKGAYTMTQDITK
jgi:hypothetical protein